MRAEICLFVRPATTSTNTSCWREVRPRPLGISDEKCHQIIAISKVGIARLERAGGGPAVMPAHDQSKVQLVTQPRPVEDLVIVSASETSLGGCNQ
jgi:hypothetical protein